MSWIGKKIKNSFLSLTVSKKIILATTFSSVVTLSLFTAVSLTRELNSFRDKKVEQLASISRIVASNSEAALSFGDQLTASEYMDSLSQENDIVHAVLFDSEGELFARFTREKGNEVSPELPDYVGPFISKNSVHYVTRVEIETDILGTLVVVADMRSIRMAQKKSLTIAFALLFAGLALAALIAFRIQKYVTGPLVELSGLVRSVSKDQDYSRKAEKRYDDEIGTLVDGFNFMLKSVYERDEEIRSHNKNLEKEVAERTIDMQSAMEDAKAASQAKSDFLSTISHELRTPMNAIVGMTSLMIDSEMSEETRSHLDIIRGSSDNLLSLINDVLDYSKIESGKLELESEPLDLVTCFEGAMDLVTAQAQGTTRVFVTTIDPTLPATINGDLTRLRQVVINLLGNAAKFTEKGTINLEAKKLPNDWMRLSVQDTGIGIPKDRMDRLFKSFSQVDSSTTRKFGGTGLGLAISQKLAVAMGGTIKVTSEFGKVSCFYFDLPIVTEDPKKLVAGPLENLNHKATLSGFNEPLMRTLSRLLSAWGNDKMAESKNNELRILSVIFEKEEEAFSVARNALEDAEAKDSLILIAHSKHAVRLRSELGLRVVALPVKMAEFQSLLSVPDNTDDVSVAKVDQKKRENLKKSTRGLKILLAEDNKVNQRVFKLIMSREGFEVDIVNDGQEAFDAIVRTRYDIVFMDLQMPVMGGLESAELIRSMEDRISQPWIIGFTANVKADAVPALRKAGMNDYLLKPVKNVDVRSKIEYFVQRQNVGMR